MVHRFVEEAGRPWRVETTGTQRDVQGFGTVTVRFIDEQTNWQVSGGLAPSEVEKPTDERLRRALHTALAELLRDKPMVIKKQNDPTEMFQINVGRYSRLEHVLRPEGGDYADVEQFPMFDTVALREELGQLGFSDDHVNAAIALARLRFAEVVKNRRVWSYMPIPASGSRH
jgi:hypothetical protein